MNACDGGGASPGHSPPTPPEGASNPQPVMHHAGVVSAQNWSTRERGGDAKA